jgi:hypothetical protein
MWVFASAYKSEPRPACAAESLPNPDGEPKRATSGKAGDPLTRVNGRADWRLPWADALRSIDLPFYVILHP